MREVDVKKFWEDEEVAGKDPFGEHIPQHAMGIRMAGECVYAELGIEEDFWRYDHDQEWRLQLNKAYNDKAEKIVGRRLLDETRHDPKARYPGTRQIGEVLGGRNEWRSGSWWLHSFAGTPDELRAQIDRIDAMDAAAIRKAMLPENWAEEKDRMRREHSGVKPPRFRGFRGPVTLAASLYHPEKLVFLILDEPDLAARFRDAILRVALAMADVLDIEAGEKPGEAKGGFGFADDFCCLLTPEMYEFFGFPILRALFDRYAPDPKHGRYQHSDSAMGHLLPVLGRLNFTGVNFGPTVRFRQIREHMPNAVVDGTLAPFTFMRNDEETIIAEVRRDMEEAKGTRGLRIGTAGSINNGSRITSLRAIMHAVQKYGRFD